MWNLRRLGILLIITMGLVVPLLAVLVISSGRQLGSAAKQQPDSAPASPFSFGLGRAATTPEPVPVDTPIRAAGDGKAVWVLQPLRFKGDSDNTFILLQHPANQKQAGVDLWQPMTIRTVRRVVGTARGLAVLGDGNPALQPGAYVLLQGNLPLAFSLTEKRELPILPRNLAPVSLAGSAQGLWALTHGKPGASTNPAPPATAPETAPASAPATTAAATQATPRTEPAASTRPQPGELWTVQSLTQDGWHALPALGLVGTAGAPGPDDHALLVAAPDRLIVAWIASDATALVTRQLDLKSPAAWSPPHVTTLNDALPALFGLTVSGQPWLFYATPAVGSGFALQGGVLDPDGAIARPATLDIGQATGGLDPQRDVAVAAESNSLLVVLQHHDAERSLYSLLFSPAGQRLAGPSPVKASAGTLPDAQLIQNLGLILLAALLVTAMWMRQRRPVIVRMPRGLRIAMLWQRVLAGLIDLIIPVVAVAAAFGISDIDRFRTLFQAWFYSSSQPEQLFKYPALLWILGGYVGLALVSELATGRTLGKALLGLRVVGLDGQRATPGSILMRNVVRIPELLLPLLLLFILLSTLRQRIGDVLARTLVVEKSPGAVGPSEGGAPPDDADDASVDEPGDHDDGAAPGR